MSSIVGVYGKNGENVFQYLVKMLRETTHRGSKFAGIDIDHSICKVKGIEKLLNQNIKGCKGIGVVSRDVEQPFQYEGLDLSLVCDGEIYNKRQIEDLTGSQLLNNKESILLVFKKFLSEKQNVSNAVERTLEFLEGIYAFALFYKNYFLITRDRIGVKPLYISEEKGRIAFASERKALWSIGMFNTYPLPPSSWAVIRESGIKINYIKNLEEQYFKEVSLEKAEKELLNLLLKSVEKRLKKRKPFGVLFSGGLDSVVLTKIVKDLGYEPILYCSGAENSKDIRGAMRAAEELELPIKFYYMTLEKLKEKLPNIVYMIEETNPLQVSIALPVYFSTLQAKNDDLEFMMSGTGADELFGGYARYIQILESGGYTALHRALLYDIKNIAEENLQRDDAASMSNSVELVLPYLDCELVKYALSIPPRYKIVKIDSICIRKFILRKIAERIGLPKVLVERQKIAMQYGSYSYKLLQELAQKNGFNKNLSKKYGYHSPLKLYIETVARLKKVPGTKRELEELVKNII
ncbi:MAG: asparagine synthase-related protein [Candidatus Jordarchaeum sp.]|uniref:asparagine synthase-related protein n=1 Tax=Candidatus Jordarchaeum sp. TaxID=2823881 RepID=UPI004049F737